ncbi:MAG TPA: response regulator transcription factor [Acetobacteraceae bacterium]|jgi:DNA-binding NarL/FixJ family response regulator|nr:response regulator transcription factor [Acetobacteraceae bacterium]
MNGAQKGNRTASGPLAKGVSCAPQAGNAAGAPHSLLILSDIRFFREGLAETLARDGAFHVVGAVAGVDEAFCISRASCVQIILIDAALPDGLVAARRFRDLGPSVRIVALALAETEVDVIAWAEAGASGYIPRSVALDDFVAFVQEIIRGQQACSRQVAAGLLRWVSGASGATKQSSATAASPELTAREEQVAALICAGLTNKEISRRLNIGVATTKSHIHNLLGKLALQRRGQVARWSRDHGSYFVRGVSPRDSTSSPPLSPPSSGRLVDNAPARTRPP